MGTPNRTGDRVLVISTTPGTGTYQLGPAAGPAFRTLASAGVPSGSRVMYVVQDDPIAPTLWEEVEGIYAAGSPDTLTRATIKGGSNGLSPVNWPTGTRYIFLTVFADRTPILDTDGKVSLGVIPALPTAVLPVAGIWSGTFALTSIVVFIYAAIPPGTRFLTLNGILRGAAPGGALDVIAGAALRNADDTADAANFGSIGSVSVAAGGSIATPLTLAWDLGAPITSTRTMRFSAATSGPTLNLYEYRVSISCGRE